MTHYEVLGVDTNATFDEIKDSYRQKLLVLHPDKQPTVNTRSLDSNDGFLQLRVAWDVLSNETLRHDYDLMLRVQISKTNKIGLEQVIATTTEASTEYPVIFSCSCSTLISVSHGLVFTLHICG